MPIGMPEKSQITIQKRELPADFRMPQMEMAETHYSIGYILSGDRRIITPYQQIDCHAGNLVTMPPMLYHRTFSLSTAPYVNYLIKLSQEYADFFCSVISPAIWRTVFEQRIMSFSDADSAKTEAMLSDLLEISESRTDYTDTLLNGLMNRLIVFIHDHNRSGDGLSFRNKLSEEIMESMYFIEQHYADEIRLSTAAQQAGFSEGHLSRLFVSQVGVSFSEYLMNVRLRHVKELLIQTDRTISEIAMQTGFSNSDYLSSCFHKHEGMTPSAFRRGNRSSGREGTHEI